MNSIELILTILLGYVFFLIEEFEASVIFAVSSILVSSVVSVPLSIVLFRKSESLKTFAMVTSVQLLLTSVLRPALVYRGFVTSLQGVDAFGMLGLNVFTYLIFALSGILTAIVIKRFDPGPYFRIFPIVFSSLGVLYTYKLSSGFWFPISTFNGIVLIIAEFTSPIVYALLGIWPVRYWSRCYHGR